jgi:hypothetical protein
MGKFMVYVILGDSERYVSGLVGTFRVFSLFNSSDTFFETFVKERVMFLAMISKTLLFEIPVILMCSSLLINS